MTQATYLSCVHTRASVATAFSDSVQWAMQQSPRSSVNAS